MALPSFYRSKMGSGILSAIEKQRVEKNDTQKKLSAQERKELFNNLSAEDKKKCLVDLKKKMPVTPGDIDGIWYNSKGHAFTDKELQRIKDQAVSNVSTMMLYCWIHKGNQLFLREFDSKFRETNKAFSQITERNDLAILVKGEKFLENKNLVTFETYRNTK